MAKVEYEYAGVKYIGLAELARGTNCTKSVLRRRLDSGWSVKDAVEKPVQTRRKELYVYKAVEYLGVAALSRATGVPKHILYDRLVNQKLSVEEAVETPILKPVCIDYNGVHYDTLQKFADSIGKPRSVVESRLNAGWPIDDIVNLPVGTKSKCRVLVKGVWYKDRQSAIKDYGLTRDIVRHREASGMSFEDAVSTPYTPKVEVYKWGDKEFVGISNAAKHLGVSTVFISRRLDNGVPFDKICEEAVAFVAAGRRTKIDYRDYPGCKKSQVADLERLLDYDISLCKTWLAKCFMTHPTEFHGVVYNSVEDACNSIPGLEIGVIRARMLRNQLEFQDAVHDRYYVVDGTPFKLMREMSKYLGISNFSLQKLIKDCTCNDEVVKIAMSLRGSLRPGSVAQSLSMNLRDASSVTVIGEERYLVYCKCCGRPVVLSGDDVRSFKHSDEFCSSHTCIELYENGVTVSQLCGALARYGTFEAAVASYRDAEGVSILRRNLNRDSVGTAKLLCNGRYMLIKCSVCDRYVMFPIEDVKLFEHSGLCEKYEWQ